MIDFNKYNNNLNDIFSFFNILLYNLDTTNNFNYIYNILTYILLFCINNLYLLNKLQKIINNRLHSYIINKKKYLNKIQDIEKSLHNLNSNIIKSYNDISIKSIEKIELHLIKNIEYNTKYENIEFNNQNNKSNLELYNLHDIDNLLTKNNSEYYKFYKNDDNFIDYKYINIGYGNYYKLNCYKYLKDTLPFNLLMYIQELDQIVIKIGDDEHYRYINSKLYKVYNSKNEKNINNKSIICNNNIRELGKKCYIDNCKYYHDYIIGYKDNFHKDRQFSSNPIVFNCNDFKDGSKIKENLKKIEWYDAINLYQSSLSTLLIGCVHSLK